jgi:hypothetical protein
MWPLLGVAVMEDGVYASDNQSLIDVVNNENVNIEEQFPDFFQLKRFLSTGL